MNFSWKYSLLLILFWLPFGSDTILSCTPFMVYMISTAVDKTSVLLFGIYIKINNCIVKTFYRVFITEKGNCHVMNHLTNIFLVPFFGRLFICQYFTMYQLSTGLFYWWKFMLLHVFIQLHVYLFLIRVWCLTWRAWSMNVKMVNSSAITSVCYLQG